eukprot:6190836-Pleurochrysis_carterae.AAC.3
MAVNEVNRPPALETSPALCTIGESCTDGCPTSHRETIHSAPDAPQGDSSSPDLSWMRYEPHKYSELLQQKTAVIRNLFGSTLLPDHVPFHVYASAPSHFRQRARFAIARFPPSNALRYALFNRGAPSVAVDTFPIASRSICDKMPVLMEKLNLNSALSAGIAAVHFLSTQSGELLISLIYSAPLAPDWETEAAALRCELGLTAIVGRAKATRVVIERDWVTERLRLADGRELLYRQVEGSFSNPSAAMCEHTLNFLCESARAICDACSRRDACTSEAARRDACIRSDACIRTDACICTDACNDHVNGASNSDGVCFPTLLELYCGNGNHTVALASHFSRTLAVEINPNLVAAANTNLSANGVDNAQILCAPSAKACKRLLRSLARTSEDAPRTIARDAASDDARASAITKGRSSARAMAQTSACRKTQIAAHESVHPSAQDSGHASDLRNGRSVLEQRWAEAEWVHASGRRGSRQA